jgi:uncharacterized protein YjbJ (UPF0337 family)
MYEDVKEVEMLGKLQTKLGKTKEEVRSLIDEMKGL